MYSMQTMHLIQVSFFQYFSKGEVRVDCVPPVTLLVMFTMLCGLFLSF